MKFRNIITLLFMVTVFSSVHSMSDGRRSPLSQEVNLDTGARINHISSCIFDSEIVFEKFENRIIELNDLFKNCYESFLEKEMALSDIELLEYKKKKYNYFVNYVGIILELREDIDNNLDSISISELIPSLDNLEKNLNSFLDLCF